jgi:hypothetical protein
MIFLVEGAPAVAVICYSFVIKVPQFISQLRTNRTWAHFRVRHLSYPPHYREALASSDIPNSQAFVALTDNLPEVLGSL